MGLMPGHQMAFPGLLLILPTVLSTLPILQETVDYPPLGSFTNGPPYGGTLQRPLRVSPMSPEIINTRFLLFTRDNPDTYQEISARNPNNIHASNFRTDQKTYFIIHGYTEDGLKTWIIDMCEKILKLEDANCISVDWLGGSRTFYEQSANNIRVVGAEVAYFISIVKNECDNFPSKVHIIGHSLGAHAGGEAGKRTPGIDRVTGLDPAFLLFQDTPPEVRLDPTDAQLVDIIHTDAFHLLSPGFGMSQTCGHMDFFPNGGSTMPGCGPLQVLLPTLDAVLSLDIEQAVKAFASCDHIRSYEYYTESIVQPDGFLGYQADSYKDFLEGNGFPCPSGGCPKMGHFVDEFTGDKSSPGQMYYLTTGAEPNFSRWRYKLSFLYDAAKPMFASMSVSLEGEDGSLQNLKVYSGLLKPNTTYSSFVDAEKNIGNIISASASWTCYGLDVFFCKPSASSLTVQDGKDGAIYLFCDSETEQPPDSPQQPSLNRVFLLC